MNTIIHYWVLVNTIEQHGNRLCGFRRLWSKMSDWMDGVDGVDTPWTVMTTRAPAVLTNRSNVVFGRKTSWHCVVFFYSNQDYPHYLLCQLWPRTGQINNNPTWNILWAKSPMVACCPPWDSLAFLNAAFGFTISLINSSTWRAKKTFLTMQ